MSWSCGSRASRLARICPSCYARELKLRESFRRGKARRSGRESLPASLYVCGLSLRFSLQDAASRTASRVAVPKFWRRTKSWNLAPLYAENCAGCHGPEGRGGAAIALANPVYLAIADDASMRKVIAQGVRGTAMPAFAAERRRNADRQADRCDSPRQIRSRWSRRGILDAASTLLLIRREIRRATPNAAKRHTRLIANLATDPIGRGGQKASAITDDSFLALVSDQGLRTIVIAGRPELGAPDWRGNVPRQADVRPGNHRRSCLARLTAAFSGSGPTIFRFQLRSALGV